MKIDDFFVTKTTTLKEAMRVIDHSGLRVAFVVEKDRTFEGIITDGDIRRAILKGVTLDESIEDIYNKNPIIVEFDKIDELLSDVKLRKIISDQTVTQVPILKDKKIVDILHIFQKNDEVIKTKFKDLDKIEEYARPIETILIIGGAGYLGSMVCRELLQKGYKVKVLDNILYSDVGIKEFYKNKNFTLVNSDMRSIETVVNAIKGVDAVILLAAIVGDPASAIKPQNTIEVNYHSTKMIADICRYHQINRFLYASTCSVYGRDKNSDKLTEESVMNPLSLYAKTKIESEKAIIKTMDGNFSPTILRLSTLYGLSPRMRFDLVVNILVAKAINDKQITIFGGKQYRPLVHVADAASAFVACLEAPLSKVKGEIFNVGSNDQNYMILDLGKIIHKEFPDAELLVNEDKEDERSYFIDFTKLSTILNFKPKYRVIDACNEIREAFEKGIITGRYTDPIYSNFGYLKNSPHI